MNFLQGEIIAIDKPYRMSSFGALAHIRYLLSHHLGQKVKVGHAGTLDPLATGVLILCTGRCTKQIEQLQSHSKEYTATLQLGATTDSYDMEHEVNHIFPRCHLHIVPVKLMVNAHTACAVTAKVCSLRQKISI